MIRKFAPALVAASLFASHVQADQPTLYVAVFGGSFEKLLKEQIVPDFEKLTSSKVILVPGDTTTTMARMQAQKGKQTLDVAFLDDGPMAQAAQLGYCETLTDAPVYKELFDVAHFKSNKAVTIGLNGTGIVYNERVFAAKGWAPPTSWKDLANPLYKGHVQFPSITNGYGIEGLVMFARLNGGGEQAMEPGFAAIKKDVAPNVLSFDPSPGKISELFQNDSLWIGVWGSGRTQALRNQGVPVKFVAPKEGAMALGLSVCPVKHETVNALAQKFVQYTLSPEVQVLFADGEGVAPVNKNTKLPPSVQAKVPDQETVAGMLSVDWDVVNAMRPAWIQQWNRQIEQ
ncbi:branched-chain amino acid ABC transporter substrate-binding protein [Pseudomonas syringae]|uniref:Branched-chain amino acid ABC transporter substrate-binding protein n=1 Tax=Pseudomonas syringae TaxID=317 RepID=A0A1C7YZU2_PSESX|nr:ABC transporter substrate-binding protein [Pseudomonas syringae]OCR22336.1 branched-chain amino acid ABC transporter substrate-binding protein [Pseudomonas syringae]